MHTANKNLISIIVPVYNMERFLHRCIDSILAQTYGGFELLLIDDGSSDSSGAICDSYEKQDKRIRVFHKENGGVSGARNYGLDRARGNYIAFVDSDDYIGPDYLRILLEMLVENDADISLLSYEKTTSVEAAYVDSNDQRTVLSSREAFREMILYTKIDSYVWGKLYRRELFEQVRFPIGKTFEDLATIPGLIPKCRRCVYSTAKQYYYFYRSDSISHAYSDSNVMDWFNATNLLAQLSASAYPELCPLAMERLVKILLGDMVDSFLSKTTYTTAARYFREKAGEALKMTPALPGVTGKEKIKARLFLFSPGLYRVIRIVWLWCSPDPNGKRFLPGRRKN